MHDCQRTKERLLDLVYHEAGDEDGLRAEVEACANCRAELRALTETLRAYERASADDDPPEQFWAGYHARLAAQLRANAPAHNSSAARNSPAAMHAAAPSSRATSSASRPSSPRAPFAAEATPLPASTARRSSSTARLSFSTARLSSFPARLRTALTATWRVPAPVALTVALLCLCLSVLALRPTPEPLAVEPPAQSPAQIRTVEVPFVTDRTITRTVYVARRERARRATPSPLFDVARRGGGDYASARRDEATLRRGELSGQRGDGPPAEPRADTLVGFRPAGDVRLRVVKGSYEHEK